MYNCRAAGERPEKSHHEINRVVRRQDAEVAYARPKRIKRSQRDTLLQIILVRHHGAFRAAAGSGGIHDASCVLAFARNETRFASATKIFPTPRVQEFRVCWSLG